MYVPFSPKDDLSAQLLKSIPRKVAAWLDNLDEDLSVPGDFGQLRWNFGTENGTIIYGEGEDSIQIWWTGAVVDPSEVVGSDKRFENIVDNLDFFVEVEKLIYGELEKLQEKLDEIETRARAQKGSNV